MPSSLQLRAGALRCDVVPGLGAAIAGLWHHDAPILRSTPGDALRNVRLAGSFPLVPFSNRIGNAVLQWNGTSHPLLQNFAPEPHAIHGVGWQQPWTVLDASDDFVLMAYEHRSGVGWPFAFDCSQALRLAPDALEMALSVTNQSDAPAPMGLGWHPYFVKRPGARIRFAASGRWETGADNLPTHRAPSHGLDAVCDDLVIDHCFDGWHGEVGLVDAVMDVAVSASVERLVVYTNPTRDFVAVEPVSHVNNAVNLAGAARRTMHELGVRTVEPGESMNASMRIVVRPAP